MFLLTQSLHDEEERIRTVYANYADSGKQHLYRWYRQDALLGRYRLRAVAAAMLVAQGWEDLSSRSVLDVGCGAGAWVRTLLEWGVSPERAHGVDLLEHDIARARRLSPQVDFRVASGYGLPYPDTSMDLVCAQTVFSSITDPAARLTLAGEMQRVCAPSGLILIFDFRFSDPRNPETVHITKAEMRRLFPGYALTARSLVLAPPLSRRIAPVATWLAATLEGLCPFLRTHMLYLLAKPAR